MQCLFNLVSCQSLNKGTSFFSNCSTLASNSKEKNMIKVSHTTHQSTTIIFNESDPLLAQRSSSGRHTSKPHSCFSNVFIYADSFLKRKSNNKLRLYFNEHSSGVPIILQMCESSIKLSPALTYAVIRKSIRSSCHSIGRRKAISLAMKDARPALCIRPRPPSSVGCENTHSQRRHSLHTGGPRPIKSPQAGPHINKSVFGKPGFSLLKPGANNQSF